MPAVLSKFNPNPFAGTTIPHVLEPYSTLIGGIPAWHFEIKFRKHQCHLNCLSLVYAIYKIIDKNNDFNSKKFYNNYKILSVIRNVEGSTDWHSIAYNKGTPHFVVEVTSEEADKWVKVGQDVHPDGVIIDCDTDLNRAMFYNKVDYYRINNPVDVHDTPFKLNHRFECGQFKDTDFMMSLVKYSGKMDISLNRVMEATLDFKV
jgi:hypothetical protein